MQAKYSYSDASTPFDERGIKVGKSTLAAYTQSDPSSIVMPSIKFTAYTKSALKTSIEVKKVMNFSAYFFTFPVSLRRESLLCGYNFYNLEDFTKANYHDNELKAGIVLDTLWMNILPLPITLEYRYNDNALLAKQHNVRVFAGVSF